VLFDVAQHDVFLVLSC